MTHFFKSTFFALFLLVAITSCHRHDDYVDPIASVQKVKIDSVSVAQTTMQVYAVQSIRTYSTYNKGCEGFYDYDYAKDNLTRNVSSYSYKSALDACQTGTYSQFNQINFSPVSTGTYTFKFWNGKDASGADLYIVKTIEVQ